MEDIARIAHKVMVMSDGSLVMYDTVDKVFSRGDELKKIGLNVPQISLVAEQLRSNGVELGDGIFTVEAAKNAIIKYIKEKKNYVD